MAATTTTGHFQFLNRKLILMDTEMDNIHFSVRRGTEKREHFFKNEAAKKTIEKQRRQQMKMKV